MNERPTRRADGPHAEFLDLYPGLVRQALSAFRGLPAADREECVAEAVAAAFASFVALKARGKEPSGFPSRIAGYAVLRVKSGRAGTGGNRRDVMSRWTSGDHRVSGLTAPGEPWGEWLADNSRSSVPDQACFRIDFTDFLNGLNCRDRLMALALARGDCAGEVADRFGVTPARVTQLRRAWHRRWLALNGDLAEFFRPKTPTSRITQ